MSARIIDLSRVVAERAGRARASEQDLPPGQHFEFWTGQSGRRYVHTVYSLIDCPELPAANYVLVRRDVAGRSILQAGRTIHASASLNLADVRHRGAQLGAHEVHVHLLADTDAERRLVERDITHAYEAQVSLASA
jgi:hypothetical protein